MTVAIIMCKTMKQNKELAFIFMIRDVDISVFIRLIIILSTLAFLSSIRQLFIIDILTKKTYIHTFIIYVYGITKTILKKWIQKEKLT